MLTDIRWTDPQQARDYRKVAQAITFLQTHRLSQPDLPTVAGHVGLSPYHFQRLFTRWAGVSPKQFLAALTLDHAKALLRNHQSVLDTALDSGLSGPGRLHDLFVRHEAMTPGEYKEFGATLDIRWGVHPSPFGEMLVLLTQRGVCGLRFVTDDLEAQLDVAKKLWPLSHFLLDSTATAKVAPSFFRQDLKTPLKLLLKGTAFQVQVWRALLESDRLWSYEALASKVQHPHAVRAVGTAVGANPIAWLIPCHRVLRKSGSLGGYHYGPDRKQAMLAWETVPSDRGRKIMRDTSRS